MNKQSIGCPGKLWRECAVKNLELSISKIIREMKIKMRCHLTPIRMARIKEKK